MNLLSQRRRHHLPRLLLKDRAGREFKMAGMQLKLPNSSTFKSGRPSRPYILSTRCKAESQDVSSRRVALQSAAAAIGLLLAPKQVSAAGKTTNVGSYLPKAGDGFVQFKPSETQTPVSHIHITNLHFISQIAQRANGSIGFRWLFQYGISKLSAAMSFEM